MPRAQDSPAAAAVGHRRGCLTWHRMLVRFWRPGFLRAGACSAAPAAAGGGGAPAGWPAPPPVPAVPPPPPCARTGPAMPCAAWLGWEPGLPDSVAAAELVGAAAAPAAGAAAAAGSAPAAGGWVLATSGLVPTMRRLQLARWRAAALPRQPQVGKGQERSALQAPWAVGGGLQHHGSALRRSRPRTKTASASAQTSQGGKDERARAPWGTSGRRASSDPRELVGAAAQVARLISWRPATWSAACCALPPTNWSAPGPVLSSSFGQLLVCDRSSKQRGSLRCFPWWPARRWPRRWASS